MRVLSRLIHRTRHRLPKKLRDRHFSDPVADALAKRWWEVGSKDPRVEAVWFECDRRAELLRPTWPLAFHVAVKDEVFEQFVDERHETLSALGVVAQERLEMASWPEVPGWRPGGEPRSQPVATLVSWTTFSNGQVIDVFYERDSAVALLPRAFWKPIVAKSHDFVAPRILRGRIGKADRVIRKRPRRARTATVSPSNHGDSADETRRFAPSVAAEPQVRWPAD